MKSITFTTNEFKEEKLLHGLPYLSNLLKHSVADPFAVDIDQSGLIANGKTYDVTQKGYFSKKKNQKGYHLSAAFCGETSFITINGLLYI